MLQLPRHNADLENTATWAKFSPKLCRHCLASCCSLPVEVKAADLVRMQLLDAFVLEDDPKFIARRLMKEGLVEHFHARSATFTLARRASGDCIYLDSGSKRCTIYAIRPDTCRNHPGIGPRSGYCAFRKNPHPAAPQLKLLARSTAGPVSSGGYSSENTPPDYCR